MIKKGKKWLYCLSCMSLAFLVCLHTSQVANALGVTGASSLYLESGALEKTQTYGQTDNVGFTIIATFNKSGNDLWVNVGDPSVFDHVSLITKETIPANSIVSFVVRYQVQNNGPLSFNYYGVNFVAGRSLLSDSCIVNNLNTATGGIGMNQMECTYTYYNANATNIIDWAYGHHVMEWAYGGSQAGSNAMFNIVVGAPSYITLTNDGLSASDRAWLESVLPDSTSVGQIEQGVSDALENQSDSEREELEDTQNDAEDKANDSSDEAESETQSLREGISNIINLVRDTPASDCNIRINFRIDTGVMNMCQIPDQFKTLIQTVTTIVGTIAVLNISYELLLLYVDSIRSFQDGGKEER